jgi:hypothetical protein
MAGLVPATQNLGALWFSPTDRLADLSRPRFWVAGTSPAMTFVS